MTETNEIAQPTTSETAVAPKKRGRPKGVKNKPKPEGYIAPPRKPRAKKSAQEPVAAPVVSPVPKAAFVETGDVVESD